MAGPLYGPQPSRQALARERLAQALLGQGMDASPIQHPLQGLARLAQAYFGSQMLRRGEEDERKREGDYASGLNAALLGATDSGMIADRLAGSGNPDLVRMAPQFRVSQIESNTQAARDRAKADAEKALKEWEFKNDPNRRYKFEGGAAFDLQAPNPLQPAWTKPEKAEYDFKEIDGQIFAIDKRNPASKIKLGAAGGGGTFRGNALDAQDSNILLTGDPMSQQYALAYSRQFGPRQIQQADGTVVVMTPPVPEGIRKPGQAATAASPPPASQPQPQAAPPAPEAPASTTPLPGGGSVTRVGDPRMSQADKAKVDNVISNAATISNALEDFAQSFEGAGTGERVGSVLGATTKLNTSYNKAALLAKSEELFNLGVLNGPDLDIIRRTLPDPSTIRGQFSGPEAARAATQSVRVLLQDRMNAALKQRGLPPVDLIQYGKGLREKPSADGLPQLPPGFRPIN